MSADGRQWRHDPPMLAPPLAPPTWNLNPCRIVLRVSHWSEQVRSVNAELQLENSRLRRLVTDLLLEKVKLEEAAQSQSCVA